MRRQYWRHFVRRQAVVPAPSQAVLIEIEGLEVQPRSSFLIMNGDTLTIRIQGIVTELTGQPTGPKLVTFPITIRARIQ